MPDSIETPHRRFGATAGRSGSKDRRSRAWTPTASTCSSASRAPRDPLAPADERGMAGPRQGLADARQHLADHPRRREARRPAQRPGARADDESRTRFDRRLAGLGPDILAPELDEDAFLRRLRADDPTRPIGDALLDQRIIAGIGNMWKAEGCFLAGIDPWRRTGGVATRRPVNVRRLPSADAGVGTRRHAGQVQSRLRHRRPAVPPLRDARTSARAARATTTA